MAKIKAMGSSHVHRILAGETWGNRLGTPLSRDIEFNQANGWMIDTDELGLPEAVVTLLQGDPDFLDVTGMELIPPNKCQEIFFAVPPLPAPDTLPNGEPAVAVPANGTPATPAPVDAPQVVTSAGQEAKKRDKGESSS